MKIILRQHVEHLGEPGEVVNVARGYARNYLLPKRMALLATPGNLVQIEHQRKVWAAVELREVSESEALAAKIRALALKVVRKAGDSGTLYGSVTSSDVAELLAARGIEIDRKRLSMDPIKALGTHEVRVKLHRKVQATVKVEVVPEQGAS